MKAPLLLFFFSLAVSSQCFGGQTIQDGFVSNFVPRSPDNPDPADCRRFFHVYLPPTFFTDPTATFPIVYHLTGLGGNDATYFASDQLAMNMLLAAQLVTPMIIVAPDPRVLAYDGSFYVDSMLNGDFEQYIVQELIPYVDATYRQKTTPDGSAAPYRAIMGQSMGGYGSLYYGIKHPELFIGYAGDSPTSFWLLNTDLASPNKGAALSSMYSFTKLLTPELGAGNSFDPTDATAGGDIKFGVFAYAGAFSPINAGPPLCFSGDVVPCTQTPPYCVALPFLQTPPNIVVIVPDPTSPLGTSFLPNPALYLDTPRTVIQQWETFDPYVLLNSANVDTLRRQAAYLDAGSDPTAEIIDNVGARYFSDKLTSLNINNEFVLFQGGHTTCTTIDMIDCYRFTTNLKTFSGKFSEGGIYAPAVRSTIVGVQTIELADNSVMSILNKQLVGIETDPTAGITTTNVTFNITDSGRLEIGTPTTLGGALQVGNAYGKANLLFDPTLLTNSVSATFEIDGPQATLQIGLQGFLGFGIGVDGNQTAVPNYWGLSSLANITAINLIFNQGFFDHNQIASSADPNAALLGIGVSTPTALVNGLLVLTPIPYTFTINSDNFIIAGGANIGLFEQDSLIHPTVLDIAGVVDPGGIRNQEVIVPDPNQFFDDFYGPPNGFYGSTTYYLNKLTVGILSSSAMLSDPHKQPLPPVATADQLFTYLMVNDYLVQGVKEAPIALLDNQLFVDYLTQNSQMQEVINRPDVSAITPCNPLDPSLNQSKVLEQGVVGIKLATINGQQQIIRIYDPDPVIT